MYSLLLGYITPVWFMLLIVEFYEKNFILFPNKIILCLVFLVFCFFFIQPGSLNCVKMGQDIFIHIMKILVLILQQLVYWYFISDSMGFNRILLMFKINSAYKQFKGIQGKHIKQNSVKCVQNFHMNLGAFLDFGLNYITQIEKIYRYFLVM